MGAIHVCPDPFLPFTSRGLGSFVKAVSVQQENVVTIDSIVHAKLAGIGPVKLMCLWLHLYQRPN